MGMGESQIIPGPPPLDVPLSVGVAVVLRVLQHERVDV